MFFINYEFFFVESTDSILKTDILLSISGKSFLFLGCYDIRFTCSSLEKAESVQQLL